MRRRTQRQGFRRKRGEQRRVALQPDDHDLGGFYKGGDGLALFQAHFANGIGGDDGRNPLAAYRNCNLSEQAADLDVGNTPDELIAAADAPKIGAPVGNVSALGCAIEEAVNFFFGDAVMAARGLHRADFLLVDPLFHRGIADPEYLGCVTRREEFGCRHMHSRAGTPKDDRSVARSD